MLTNQYTQPTDVNKLSITVGGKNVTQEVVSAVIYQDIFNPCFTATLDFNDPKNEIIKNIGPGTSVNISIETKSGNKVSDKSFSFPFQVIGYGDRKFQNMDLQTYSISCVHSHIVKNQKTRLTTKYKDMRIDQIVTSVAQKEFGTELIFTETSGKIDYLPMNVVPYTMIQQLCKYANSAGDYMFYYFFHPTRKKYYYMFKPLTEIKQQPTMVKLEMKPANLTDTRNDYNTAITDFKYHHFDGIENMCGGLYGSKMSFFDIIKKEWKSSTIGGNGGGSLASPDTHHSWAPVHMGMSDKPTIIEKAEQCLPNRKKILMGLEQNKLVVQVAGGVRYHEYLGYIADVKVQDGTLNGKYLIAGLTHIIGQHSYFVNFDLVPA